MEKRKEKKKFRKKPKFTTKGGDEFILKEFCSYINIHLFTSFFLSTVHELKKKIFKYISINLCMSKNLIETYAKDH